MDAKTAKLSNQDIINTLQHHKTDILRQDEKAKQQLKSFFKELRDCLQKSEAQILRKLDQEMLGFHEAVASTLKTLGRTKSNSCQDDYENAMELINCGVIHGVKVNQAELEQLLKEMYYVKIGTVHEDSRVDLPQLISSRASVEQKTYTEAAVEQLQSERDYYQRREEQLQNKLRQLELGKKGSNIRQLSKSALQEKCSRWAIQRLREEKRVLIQRVGDASQQIMKQDTLISEQQQQIKKLTFVLSEVNGRSIAGNSTIKSGSMIVEQINHEHELELEVRNTQLTLQLTNFAKKAEELYETNKHLQEQVEALKNQNSIIHEQLVQLQRESAMINNDYQNNLRKKAAIEQEYKQLKKSHDQLNSKSEEERQALRSLVEGLQLGEKEIKQRLRHMEAEKKAELSAMEKKLMSSQQERQKLLKKLEEISNKTGQQSNYKQLLNDQITRLLRQNADLEKSIHLKEETAFQAKEQNHKLELELKEATKKVQSNKKETSHLKKANKQLQKQICQFRQRISMVQNLQVKILQFQHQFSVLQSEFHKCKQANERKNSINQNIISILKQKFNSQLSQFIEAKKLKKEKSNIFEMIEKYIEEMIVFSSKTAQIKQLRQENRQLKDKQGKQLKKKQRLSLEQSVGSLQCSVWTTTSKIFQERLKSQKYFFDQKLNEVSQILKKQQILRNALTEQLEKQRITSNEIKSRLKQQKINQQGTKNVKLLQDKNQKLEEQLKKLRTKNKRLESDISQTQSQLKKKKQLNSGLQNQTKVKEEIIFELKRQIETLKNEIDKLQRSIRQFGNKEQLLRESKESYKRIELQKEQLMEAIDDLVEKNKQLSRQLSKKEEVIKQLSCIQDKENKKKQDILIKSLNNQIIELKETVRKVKIDNDRKDEIIKNNKAKLEMKNRQSQESNIKNLKDYDKVCKQKEILQRKYQLTNTNLKKQQLKYNNLSWTIKKIFEMCCQMPVKVQRQSKGKPETTQYYTNSSVSPQALKLGTPASNLKSFISCEGLQILNLRPEDIQQCLGMEATTINKTSLGESWSMASPIMNKRRQNERKQAMVEGLQQLQRILASKEINSNLLLEQFRYVLEK